MSLRNQFHTIRENWLIVVLLIIIVLFMNGVRTFPIGGMSYNSLSYDGDYRYQEKALGGRYYSHDDFAPDVEERMKSLSAWLTTEIKRTTFNEKENMFKNIIRSSDAIVLEENINTYGEKRFKTKSAYYQFKVDSKRYQNVIDQLKNIGEVTSFKETTDDITGEYTNLAVELTVEKERLKRYDSMFARATKTEDKIEINDRIFNQERRIKYLEDRVNNVEQRVEYSTIHFTLNEKRSEWTNIMVVKFSELIRTLVQSVNGLLYFVFGVIPWALVILIGILIYRKVRYR